MIRRADIINSNHILDADFYLSELIKNQKLIYFGKHPYEKGHEFLASNENDWYKHQFPPIATDAIVGFGTNSLWDLVLSNRAKSFVMADWSPWPIINHAFLLAPLMRIALSAQELIFMINGMPPQGANGMTLVSAFQVTKIFSQSLLKEQRNNVEKLLQELAVNPEITDNELRFISTFLRPRLGDNLHPQNGYGPFPELKNPNAANLTFYYERRYSPQHVGQVESVFSSIENFAYIKNLFLKGEVFYGLANAVDTEFYDAIAAHELFKNLSHLSLAFSNIFDCGHYNGLTPIDLQKLTLHLKKVFYGKEVHLYMTTERDMPHDYIRTKLADS